MFRRMAKLLVRLVVVSVTLTGCSKEAAEKSAAVPVAPAPGSQGPLRDGEALFRQYCAPCHPDGGNVSDPQRTLHGSVLRSRHIRTPEDIILIMRNPLSRMIRFDVTTLSDRDARAIADYILTTFK